MVIEELLKLLIGEVDAQLLEAVELFEQQHQACFFINLYYYARIIFFHLSLSFFSRIFRVCYAAHVCMYVHIYVRTIYILNPRIFANLVVNEDTRTSSVIRYISVNLSHKSIDKFPKLLVFYND